MSYFGSIIALVGLLTILYIMRRKLILSPDSIVVKSIIRSKAYKLDDFDNFDLNHGKYLPKRELLKSLTLAAVTFGILRRKIRGGVGDVIGIKLIKTNGGLFSNKKIDIRQYKDEDQSLIIGYLKEFYGSRQQITTDS